MADGNPLANVPPWVYVLVLLGGGGTLGGLQMGGGQTPPAPLPQTCLEAETRAEDAIEAWRGMLTSYGLILEQLNECHDSSEG